VFSDNGWERKEKKGILIASKRSAVNNMNFEKLMKAG
jgi:hypothetical protein